MVAPLVALLVVADLSGWIQDAPETLGNWTYGFGALMAFLEFSSLVGLPAPFEVGVVLSGAAAGEGEIALPPLILLVWVAAAAGESLNFATGDHFGRPFLERHGPRLRVTAARLAWIDERFERRGGLFVLIGRFIPFVRSSMPFVAGASHMTYRSFLPWSIGGNLLWAAAFCSRGLVEPVTKGEVADGVQRVGALLFVALGGGGGTFLVPTSAARYPNGVKAAAFASRSVSTARSSRFNGQGPAGHPRSDPSVWIGSADEKDSTEEEGSHHVLAQAHGHRYGALRLGVHGGLR